MTGQSLLNITLIVLGVLAIPLKIFRDMSAFFNDMVQGIIGNLPDYKTGYAGCIALLAFLIITRKRNKLPDCIVDWFQTSPSKLTE